MKFVIEIEVTNPDEFADVFEETGMDMASVEEQRRIKAMNVGDERFLLMDGRTQTYVATIRRTE